MAASFGAPNPATRRCRSHDQCTRARPAGVPALAAGRVHSMEVLAIAEEWRPYRSLATVYVFRRLRAGRGTTGRPAWERLNMNGRCTHLDRIRDVTPSSWGCEDCLAQGRRDWVHLRVCQECGHVGCCDNSPGRHATAHFRSAGHPVDPVVRAGRGLVLVLPRPARVRTRGCPAGTVAPMSDRVTPMSMFDYDARPVTPGLVLVGTRASRGAYAIRDFLSRNGYPFEWVDVERPDAVAAVLGGAEVEPSALPLCILPDGSRLALCDRGTGAAGLGMVAAPSRSEYDLVIVGAGPAGLAAAVNAASEGLRTVVVEAVAPGGPGGHDVDDRESAGFSQRHQRQRAGDARDGAGAPVRCRIAAGQAPGRRVGRSGRAMSPSCPTAR